jgi:nucleoside phosphorylase/WD40 repeat protein
LVPDESAEVRAMPAQEGVDAGRSPAVDVVVLTALPLEYDAVAARLENIRIHVDRTETRYAIGRLPGGRCRVGLVLIGPGNLAAATLTGRAIEVLQPAAVLLVGVAGGLSDKVAVGDVVVATRVTAYHGGRDETAGFRPRPRGWPVSHHLEQLAHEVARAGTWRAALGTEPAVHFRPLVSGEVVLDSRDSATAALLAAHYSDAVAIDMESAGVFEAAHRHDFHRTVTIRAISDAADGGKRGLDAAGWQPRAAEHAAAFAVALVGRLVAARPAGRTENSAPYHGLSAFRERDAESYFGRDETADQLSVMVARSPFVTVVGRSGSGKSSLVNAGLTPRMRRRGWTVASLRPLPGRPAATTLAAVVLPLLRPGVGPAAAVPLRSSLAAEIAAGRWPELAVDVLDRTAAAGLLLCVDQFDELIAADPAAAAEHLALLSGVCSISPNVGVVLTLRPETLDTAVAAMGLGSVPGESVFLLTPMRADQVRAAIECPAGTTDVGFEPGLVERILDAVGDPSTALALVQFTLTRLWDERDGDLLTHAALDRIGGVGGAIAAYAEQIWRDEFDDGERIAVRRLFVQLVRPTHGDDALRRTVRSGDLPPELLPLARRLATTRLLVTGSDGTDTTFDLAHAALVAHWRRLRDWLAAERDFRTWQEDLRESMGRAEPLRGGRLATALRWHAERPAGLTDAERGFIAGSRRAQLRRLLTMRGIAALLVVLLALTTTFAISLRRRTDELAGQVRQNAVQALVEQSQRLASTEPSRAALLAVAAYRAGSDPVTLANLAGEYLRYRSTHALFDADVGEIVRVEVSTDGSVVAALGARGVAVWRDGPVPAVQWVRGGGHRTIALSPDGSLLAAADGYGRVEVFWPDGAVTVVREGDPEPNSPTTLSVAADNRRVLAVFPRQGLEVRDARSGTVVAAAAARYGVAWFGPSQDAVVIAEANALTVRRLDTGDTTTVPTGAQPARTVVTGDRRAAIACTSDGLTRWDLGTGQPESRRSLAQCPAQLAGAVDPTGTVALTETRPEGTELHRRDLATLLDLRNGGTAHPVLPAAFAPVDIVERIATTANRTRVITAVSTAVAVVDVGTAEFRLANSAPATLISPDGRYTVSAVGDVNPTLRLWDNESGGELASTALAGNLRPVAFTADASGLLIRSGGSLRLLDVPTLRTTYDWTFPSGSAEPTPAPGSAVEFDAICTAPGALAVISGGSLSSVDPHTGHTGQPVPLWDTEHGRDRLTGTIKPNCAIRPSTGEIAIATTAGIEVWDTGRARQEVAVPNPQGGWVSDLRFTDDGRRLVTIDFDGTARFWDATTWRPAGAPLKVVAASLLPEIVAFPTADRLIAAGVEGITIWDLDRRGMVAAIDLPPGLTRPVLVPDGTVLLTHAGWLNTFPTPPRTWAEALCTAVGRDLTDSERRSLPPGSPTRACPP